MLSDRIKGYMDDIIDVAFPDLSPQDRQAYKGYKFSIVNKECRTSSGQYISGPGRNDIEVYNPSLGPRHLAKCCLHELSHHIDLMRNGKTGHQKPFYEVYAKLVYASMDMGILSAEDFDDEWSSDRNKVRAIVAKYVPHPVPYSPEFPRVVRVHNGYAVKEGLKSLGYRWNGVEQVWERELEPGSTDDPALAGFGIRRVVDVSCVAAGPCYYVLMPGMHVDAVLYVAATGDTYGCKDVLKEYGFFWKPDAKSWLCKVRASAKTDFIGKLEGDTRLAGCRFAVVDRNRK